MRRIYWQWANGAREIVLCTIDDRNTVLIDSRFSFDLEGKKCTDTSIEALIAALDQWLSEQMTSGNYALAGAETHIRRAIVEYLQPEAA
jgi:uncharacterized protein YfaA (DUF2138 family)